MLCRNAPKRRKGGKGTRRTPAKKAKRRGTDHFAAQGGAKCGMIRGQTAQRGICPVRDGIPLAGRRAGKSREMTQKPPASSRFAKRAGLCRRERRGKRPLPEKGRAHNLEEYSTFKEF